MEAVTSPVLPDKEAVEILFLLASRVLVGIPTARVLTDDGTGGK
jgi:hypothetical protein